MKIGIVEQISYPSDRLARVRKVINGLEMEDHQIVVLCRYEQGLSKFEQYSKQLNIFRFGQQMPKVFSYPMPINLLWAIWLFKMIKAQKIDLIIVTGLRLLLPSIITAKIKNIPIVFDMVEYFPGISNMRKIGWIKSKLKPFVAIIIERICWKLVNHINVVADTQRNRLINAKVPPQKISLIYNSPILDKTVLSDKLRVDFESDLPELRFFYSGLIVEQRGLSLLLNAIYHVKELEHNTSSIKLIIVGDGDYLPTLKELSYRLKIENYIEFLGWQTPEKIPLLFQKCHVGVMPHVLSPFMHHTVPNKLFEYMLQGAPVLSTAAWPVKQIIEEEKCGVIISENPLEVAHSIINLKKDYQKLKEMGENGRRAVLQRYNWGIDGKLLNQAIVKLVSTNT